jgi:Skp family chaperone for outer membrane proteins
MQSEQEFQAAYGQAMETLITKMKTTTELIAKEKVYTLVVEVSEGGVVYSVPTIDLTAELITRFNAGK